MINLLDDVTPEQFTNWFKTENITIPSGGNLSAELSIEFKTKQSVLVDRLAKCVKLVENSEEFKEFLAEGYEHFMLMNIFSPDSIQLELVRHHMTGMLLGISFFQALIEQEELAKVSA